MLLDNLFLAFEAILANKMRSLLTTLGIIIGVAAVIAVVSIVQGLQHLITQQLQGVGATYVMVLPDLGQQGPGIVARQIKLTHEDGEAIERLEGVSILTPVVAGNAQLKYRDRQHTLTVLGVNQNWPEVNNHAVDYGRFFSTLDLAHRRKVVVVGRKVLEELRLGDEPVGKSIYVGSVPATVIGVMEEVGQSLGQNVDDLAFIPFDTALTVFGRSAGDLVQLRLQAESVEMVPQLKDQITELLRRRHKIAEGQPDDFQLLVQDELLDAFRDILDNVTLVVAGIVGIALVVGGIGIMNIMLVSVTERTREIGLRKAVGARRQDVLVQFLIEAMTLSTVGGLLGIAIGYGFGLTVVELLPGDWPPAHVPLWAILLALGFCSAVGVGFGIYPAIKAARLDPIDALRYE